MPPRQCPNCKLALEIDDGVYFDDSLNLCCVACDAIVFRVKPEEKIKTQSAVPLNTEAAAKRTNFLKDLGGSGLSIPGGPAGLLPIVS